MWKLDSPFKLRLRFSQFHITVTVNEWFGFELKYFIFEDEEEIKIHSMVIEGYRLTSCLAVHLELDFWLQTYYEGQSSTYTIVYTMNKTPSTIEPVRYTFVVSWYQTRFRSKSLPEIWRLMRVKKNTTYVKKGFFHSTFYSY